MNLKVILWAVIFVVAVLCAVGGAAFHHEPAGKFAARALVQRWGGDGTCDGTCAVADSLRGFFSNLLSRVKSYRDYNSSNSSSAKGSKRL